MSTFSSAAHKSSRKWFPSSVLTLKSFQDTANLDCTWRAFLLLLMSGWPKGQSIIPLHIITIRENNCTFFTVVSRHRHDGYWDIWWSSAVYSIVCHISLEVAVLNAITSARLKILNAPAKHCSRSGKKIFFSSSDDFSSVLLLFYLFFEENYCIFSPPNHLSSLILHLPFSWHLFFGLNKPISVTWQIFHYHAGLRVGIVLSSALTMPTLNAFTAFAQQKLH